MAGLTVRRGTSHAGRESVVARELAATAGNPDAALVLLFASSCYDADALADATSEAMAPSPVVGCTTAGEIGPGGFSERSAVAMSLAAPDLRLGVGLSSVAGAALSCGRQTTLEALTGLGVEADELSSERHVGVTLIDGNSGQEELFIAGAAATAAGIQFVGGSASDELPNPCGSRIFAHGSAHTESGIVLILELPVPFTTVITAHMDPTEQRVVVTACDPEARLVHELNGRPARMVYEQIVGSTDIDGATAAQHPFGHYLGDQAYVRSVMAVEGASLRFACAVNQGAVLRPMRAGDLIATTEAALSAAAERVGDVGALIAFNCLGRYLEAEMTGKTEALARVLTRYPVIGFNTLGEQYNALHVNHTLTGLALGKVSDG